MIVRLGTLHALILALMFAQEVENHLSVVKLITGEAGAIADVYYGIERYYADASPVVSEIRSNIAHYVENVLDEEWHMLNDGLLSTNAWIAYNRVDVALLKLSPSNDYERTIRQQILSDWDEVSEYRRGREAAAARKIPFSFWSLAIAGFIFVIFPYSVFTPNPVNLMLITLLGTFNGLVFYFIIQLSNPFTGTSPIEPVA